MPKVTDKGHKLSYPPGCKPLDEDISKDELVKRLKLLARAFQDMGQDEHSDYKQLALFLATEFYMDHSSKDVRLLVACCIADIFRIFAPEAPYTEADHLKEIFMFLTQQLRGLADPESPSFKRYFYLLENLAWVKSFNICLELEDNQEIFCSLFKLLFGIVSEKHSSKVVNFMLDVMCPLIAEADSVSPELLDLILKNIIQPWKSRNKHAYTLARDLLKKTSNAIEPYIQTFFNNALMLGKAADSEISTRLYDVIYELNSISPSVLLAVLPQLEFKLKSSDVQERNQVTSLLAKMFSDPDSDLATQHKPLWNCFLGRYNDIEIDVRRICVQTSASFIINHKELVKDVADHLRQRQHDPDENVRIEVVQAIVNAAKKEFSHVSDDLLECVKERTLDKKFKIRKEALMGLGQIYHRCVIKDDPDPKEVERVAWIRNKIFHAYYQNSMDDRVLVERILNTSLVPYSLEPAERMRRLFSLYGNLDDHAVKAMQEVFRTQLNLRGVVRSLLEVISRGIDRSNAQQSQMLQAKLLQIAKNLPDAQKAQEHLRHFIKVMQDDMKVRNHLARLVSPDCSCKKAEEHVKEILRKLGNPIPQNYVYSYVKLLLERIAPLMIDAEAVEALTVYVDGAVRGSEDICQEVEDPVGCGMRLLVLLSQVFSGAFQSENVFALLVGFVKQDDDVACDMTLQIFANVGRNLERTHSEIHANLLPVLQKIVKIGTPRQAKHAVRCIHTLCHNSNKIFDQIFTHLKKNMDLDSPNFLTSLVAIGHMTQLCPSEFAPAVKNIVSRFIVKELLMQDRGFSRSSTESWCADHLLSEETQAKLQALKMMTRWLLGVKSDDNKSATSTLRLLYTLVLHEGDLMEKGRISRAEMSRLRLQAACCILKLVQEPAYQELLTLEQFQTIALLLNDPCYQVRVNFAQKLHKGLLSLRLPLQFLSMFCLAANDPMKERRAQVKQFLQQNIQRRREYLKQQPSASASSRAFYLLPDYVLPYAIHLLAHDPELQNHTDVRGLRNIKDCLWFIMEPLILKNESYSYTFYKKMIENIKQTKDAQNPDDETANMKLYAVCDLALSLVLTKTTNFVLKDFPAEPLLPARLFTQPDKSYSNNKVYLPEELMIPHPGGAKPKRVLGGASSARPMIEKKIHITEADHAPSPPSSPQSSTPPSPKASPKESNSRGRRGPKPKAAPKRGKKPVEESEEEEEDHEDEEQVEDEEEEEEEEEEVEEEEAPVRRRVSRSTEKSKGGSSRQTSTSSTRSDSKSSATSPSPSKRKAAASSSSARKQVPITSMFKRVNAASSSPARASRSKAASAGRGQRTAASPQARAGYLKKRGAEDSEEWAQPTPSKKAKAAAAQKSVRNAVRNLNKDMNDKGSKTSKQPAKRGRSQASSESPSKSSSASDASPRKKRAAKEEPRKAYPVRQNVRKAPPFLNGTSDGEEGTPDSQRSSGSMTSRSKRASTRASEPSEQNTKKRVKRKK